MSVECAAAFVPAVATPARGNATSIMEPNGAVAVPEPPPADHKTFTCVIKERPFS